MNKIFEKDLYRYYGNKGENKLKKIFRPLEIKYIYYLRKCQCAENKLIKTYYKLKDYALENNKVITFDANYRDALFSHKQETFNL